VKPDVRYARSGEYRLAYQILGDGPRDLLYLPPYASNLEWLWEHEPYGRFLEGLASFSRLILMDKRGWGCSDRLAPNEWPPIEDRLGDVDAVLDDAGSTRAVVFGGDDSGFLAVLAAAARPERISGLVLFGAAPT
jgi:pimeloyl-ACP methyl ester carboxylesterase